MEELEKQQQNPETNEETPEEGKIDISELQQQLEALAKENEFLKQVVANQQQQQPEEPPVEFTDEDIYDPRKLVDKITESVYRRLEQQFIPKLQSEYIKQEAATAVEQTMEHYKRKYGAEVAEELRIRAKMLAEMYPNKYAMMRPSQAVASAFKDAEELLVKTMKAFGAKRTVDEEIDNTRSVPSGKAPEPMDEWKKKVEEAQSVEETISALLDIPVGGK